MPFFEFDGIGLKTGRKRVRTYFGQTLDEAINEASKDGTVVDPATAQRVYPMQHVFTKAAGVSHDGRQKIICKCKPGEILRLVHEPRNKFSRHAVAIFLNDGGQCGYVNDELAAEVLEHMKAGTVVLGIVTEITGGGKGEYFGLNFAVQYIFDRETPADIGRQYAQSLLDKDCSSWLSPEDLA